MALRNTSSSASASSAPAFETEDTIVSEATPNTIEATKAAFLKQAAEAEAQAQAVDTAPKQEVVVRPANAVAAPSGLRVQTVLDQLREVIGTDMLATIGFGAFPRIVVSPGQFSIKADGKLLGDEVEIVVQSWNYVTLITTGEKDNKEADKLLRSSYDGQTIVNTNQPVDDYIRELKVEGYDKATAKKYMEIYCNVVSVGKAGVDLDKTKLYQISVPPTSAGTWLAFLLAQKLAQNAGGVVTNKVKLTAGSRSGNGNTWGTMDFSSK